MKRFKSYFLAFLIRKRQTGGSFQQMILAGKKNQPSQSIFSSKNPDLSPRKT